MISSFDEDYIASFCGYAPADDPQIAIYVVVDRVNDYKQDNVKLASLLARDILTEVLPYLGIYMTEELSDKEIKELEEKQLEITRQYSTPPKEDASEGDDTDANSNAPDGDGAQTGDTATAPNTPWKDFPIDPVTGYDVNPQTGEKVDPDTGQPVEETFSAFE